MNFFRKAMTVIMPCVGAALLCSCSTYRDLFPGDGELVVVNDYALDIPPPEVVSPEVEIEDGRAIKQQRQVILISDLYLLVENIDDTLTAITDKAEAVGGYMQSINSKSITVRIPSTSSKSFIADVELLGKITDRKIKAEDVTELMVDYQIRLDNAEQLRKRYTQLLDKGGNVTDLLEIETALAGVTETIELIKGKIRYYKNKIAFSTVRVHLNSSVPQVDPSSEIPIIWVSEIGKDIGSTNNIYFGNSYVNTPVNFDLPDDFVMSSTYHLMRAMSPKGVYLSLTTESNLEGGSLEFWTEIIERSLQKSNAVNVLSKETLTLDTGWPFSLIRAEKVIHKKKYGYYLGVAVFKDKVFLYDGWGDINEFNLVKENIVTSMKSMAIGTWFDYLTSPSLW